MTQLINKDVIVIVGGLSSGRFIAPVFNGLGYNCVHVCIRSAIEHPILKPTFNPPDYVENHVLESEDEAGAFVQKMRGRRVKAVIAGSEPCVLLADKLGEMLDTPRNLSALSTARRSKFLMHETLRRNGLRSAEQLLSDDLQEIYAFHERIGGKIVLKPEAGANTDSVYYGNTRAEIAQAVDRILGAKCFYDDFNAINAKVLVQEYLSGKQYLVNTLSSDGHHYVCDAWGEVRENDDAPSNDSHADLVHSDCEDHRALADYASRACDALGIRYGAAHFEIRMTEQGPCLVEVGARMSGNVDFAVLHDIHSLTQLSLLPDALLDPQSFLARVRAARPGSKSARKVYLSSDTTGDVLRDPDLRLFTDIETVRSVLFRVAKGDRLYKTDRSQGHARPGQLYMVADTPAEIERDYPGVRRAERLLYETMLHA
ncbi:ATP-grasp domain-containing protein [Burkholderia metallica]|uniref:ATP-grasp domain-containing protein n=1 Tax=Burkholderia metallica TaxID=488729 RepID=UPI000D1A5E57|nr:ATP-grasp domain-containing protein [Burkholderia metallica]